MNGPEDIVRRRVWAESYNLIAIQANSLANMLLDPDIHLDDARLRQFGKLITEFGAGIEVLLIHLYDIAQSTYNIPKQDFMLMGGFRQLKEHNDGHHNHHNEGE